MTLNPFKKPKLLCQFLEMCKANEYFSASASNAVIESVVFLRHMTRLQSNVEQQWLANGTGADNALKTYGQTELEASKANSSLLHRYSVVCKQDRAAKFTPFGLVDITEVQQNNESGSGLIADAIAANKIGCETSDTDDAIGINLGRGGKRLTCSYLVTDKQSQEYFYRMPRLRKIWWMKYAAHPGRFLISEIKQDPANNAQRVVVKAKYPFGTIDVEHVELLPLEAVEPDCVLTKSMPTKVIRTTTIAEIAAIETVFDAIDAGDFGEMCFNRVIAPYHCAIFCISEDPADVIDLYDLSGYVSMLLQQSNITVIQTNDLLHSPRTNLDDQFNRIDAIGIPFSLVLDGESLRMGFVRLRNRDTTLLETIHICQLTDYLTRIF